MVRRRTKLVRGAGATALALTIGMISGGSPVHAKSASDPIAQGLVGPLQFAVANNGDVYVAQSFIGVLTKIDKHGTTDMLVPAEGIDVKGPGSISYTSSVGDEINGITAASVNRMNAAGMTRQLADTLRYEREKNPDQVISYGFQGLSSECAAQVPPEIGGFPYDGLVDSHPYSVAIGRGGDRFVADAGSNNVLAVNEQGRIRTVAVLPPTPFVITEGVAAGIGLPQCTVGHAYNFESVPTDVEVGPDGWLYVSSLPGGPEDGSLGALGSVYRINPMNGKMSKFASGLAGATNVAVAPDGRVFVAELYAGRVSKIVNGAPVPLVSLPDPAAVEFANGKLFVSYDVFANGTIATLSM